VLSIYDKQLAWRAIHDVRGVGVRTLILDAIGGKVLVEKFDQELSAAGTTPAAGSDA
jgi:hypothetical protein